MERPGYLSAWWLAIRPKTLTAVIAPVLIGQWLAYEYDAQAFDTIVSLVIFCCAICLQIGVNLANDVFDFIHGVDGEYRLGPARAAQQGWLTQQQLMVATGVVLGVAALLGIFLVIQGGWLFLGLGGLSLLAALAYSAGPFPLSAHALGEVTVFLFFGLLAVCGGYYLQVGHLSGMAWQAGVMMGLLTAAIMLVNNLRDYASDRQAGKKTLVMIIGRRASRFVYSAMMIVPTTWLLQQTQLLQQSWLGWLGMLCAVGLSMAVFRWRGAQLNILLARSAAFCLVYALLFVAGHLL